jgi:hypothetical protein
LFSSKYFWNNLYGEKILIYQEDACIFNSNINDFLKYDYIGAPWPLTQNDNDFCVGNGGFSLRSKSVMLSVINTISIENTKYNSHTLEYIKNSNSTIPPEDVYFSKNIIDFKLGIVAPHDIAQTFSMETIYNENSLGGHNFHICTKNWKQHMYNKVIKQAYIYVELKNLEHRCGWGWVLCHLFKNDLIVSKKINEIEQDKLIFLDMIEKHFMWENLGYIHNKWFGFLHCTNIAPHYLDLINTDKLFDDRIFINSLTNCKCIIVLSNYLLKYVNKKLNYLNINIPVYYIKYPCYSDNVIKFTCEKFINNSNKKLIQVGQQLRIITSIYVVDTKFDKLWLPGTKNKK